MLSTMTYEVTPLQSKSNKQRGKVPFLGHSQLHRVEERNLSDKHVKILVWLSARKKNSVGVGEENRSFFLNNR